MREVILAYGQDIKKATIGRGTDYRPELKLDANGQLGALALFSPKKTTWTEAWIAHSAVPTLQVDLLRKTEIEKYLFQLFV
jgi:hypothetical protein